ncbi:MAG TPA: MBL fold metallo-hydrolase [Candidatus Binataceae bacterium]|nr:MBL fold metallo-hydrolase [Candidatus Binataceae bacterium]
MNRNRAKRQGASVTVTVLGSGDAFASFGRGYSGYLIDAPGVRAVLEAGPTLVYALKNNRIVTNSIDVIIISHLHGDHFAGLPFLILEYMWENPLKKPLTMIGPPKLAERTWRLMQTMYPRFELAKIQHQLKFVVLEPGASRQLSGIEVSAIRSPHTKPDVSLSVGIEAAGKKIVFTGDSGWNDDLLKFSAGADLFLCECTYFKSRHRDFHLDYPLIAANRDKFDVRRMVLTHLGSEVLSRKEKIGIALAFDGMKIKL